MNSEIVLDIVLSCLIGAMQLSVYVICAVWRITRYHKGLHYSAAGFIGLFFFALVGIFLPIGGFTFMDGGTAGTKSLIFAVLMCPLILPFAVRGVCFCIFVDGKDVVQRTLFTETRIDLSDPKTLIDDTQPFGKMFWIKIYSSKKQTIAFNSGRIEGDLTSFLKACKEIQNKEYILRDNRPSHER